MRLSPAKIATWSTREPFDAKNTRSPGRRAAMLDGARSPTAACCRDVRGNVTPLRAKTYCVNPEQSKPLGEFPPYR